MTPQERAAVQSFYYSLHAGVKSGELQEHCEQQDIDRIVKLMQDTRRAALLEAAQVAITYGGRARDEDLSGSDTSELIVQALDRLAQEG